MPDEQLTAEDLAIQIVPQVPTAMRSGSYANYVRVSHGEHDFILDFCLTPPAVDVDRAQLQRDRRVEADLVSRVLLPAPLLPGLIKALQNQLERHEELLESTKREG